jgi:hypothetical protein
MHEKHPVCFQHRSIGMPHSIKHMEVEQEACGVRLPNSHNGHAETVICFNDYPQSYYQDRSAVLVVQQIIILHFFL